VTNIKGAVRTLRNYPQISKWLGFWLEQLRNIGNLDDYRVIIGELEQIEGGTAQEEHDENLKRLDYHLCIASTVSRNFDSVFSEKRNLGSDVHEANARILDKLAEIRAIVGLHRLGFEDIEFMGTPDFVSVMSSKKFLVEVTRLGASMGKRSKVWAWEWGSIESGVKISELDVEKSTEALLDAIYDELESKCAQLKKSEIQADGWIVWISHGRDYLTANLYELPNVGLLEKLAFARKALNVAVREIRNTGLYGNLSHVVLSLGRDRKDLVSPEISKGG